MANRTSKMAPLIDRSDGRLVISRRTHRPGDFVHYVFGLLAVFFGVVVLVVGLSAGTLFDTWVTPTLVAGCLGYGWFAATKRANRRVVTVDASVLRVADGPLFSVAPSFEVPTGEIGKVRTRRARRLTMPPISMYSVYHVEAAGLPRALYRALPDEQEADGIRAALVSFLARTRMGTQEGSADG